MIEVEIKIAINDPDSLKATLLSRGFTADLPVREIDQYFDNAAHEIVQSGSALRLRSITSLDGMPLSSRITYKGAKLDHISNTRPEYETSIENDATMRSILQSLGYVP